MKPDKLPMRTSVAIIASCMLFFAGLGLLGIKVWQWNNPQPENILLREQARLEQLINKEPDNVNHYINLGWNYFRQKKLDEALTVNQRAVALNPAEPAAYYNLGLVLAEKGNLNEAVTAFKKVTSLDPANDLAHYNLGVIYRLLNNHQSSLDSLLQAVKLAPATGNYYHELGITYDAMGNKEAARQAYEKTLRFIPDSQEARLALKGLDQNKGKI